MANTQIPADHTLIFKHPRYAQELPVVAQFVFPDETLMPRSFDGRTLNISAGGMLIALRAFPHDFHVKLLNRAHQIRIKLILPDSEEQLKLDTEIRWSDFHRKPQARTGICYIGLRLTEHRREILGKYWEFIKTCA